MLDLTSGESLLSGCHQTQVFFPIVLGRGENKPHMEKLLCSERISSLKTEVLFQPCYLHLISTQEENSEYAFWYACQVEWQSPRTLTDVRLYQQKLSFSIGAPGLPIPSRPVRVARLRMDHGLHHRLPSNTPHPHQFGLLQASGLFFLFERVSLNGLALSCLPVSPSLP